MLLSIENTGIPQLLTRRIKLFTSYQSNCLLAKHKETTFFRMKTTWDLDLKGEKKTQFADSC